MPSLCPREDCQRQRGADPPDYKGIQIGYLVEHAETGCVGRVNSLYGGNVYFGSWRVEAVALRIVSTEPAEEEDKEPDLYIRRRKLLTKLAELSNKSDLPGLYDLRRKLGSSGWFWSYVALSLDNPRHISYPSRIEDVDSNKRRRHCSLYKFLTGPAKKLGGLDLPLDDIQRICEAFGEAMPGTWEQNVEVIRGEGIVEAYQTGPHSCMHGKDYTRWYEDNPERIALLLVRDGDKTAARCVLFTTDQGTIHAASVYSDDTLARRAIADKCRAEGWNTASPTGATVTMKPPSNGLFPYLDIFRSTESDPRGKADIVLNDRSHGDVSFASQTGGWSGYYGGESEYECDACGCALSEDELHTDENGDGYCGECYRERYVYLNYRGPGGRWVEREECREDVYTCSDCSGMFLSEHVTTDTNDRTLCFRCQEDYTLCPTCEEFTDEAEEVEDEFYCAQCAAEERKRLEEEEKRGTQQGLTQKEVTCGTCMCRTTDYREHDLTYWCSDCLKAKGITECREEESSTVEGQLPLPLWLETLPLLDWASLFYRPIYSSTSARWLVPTDMSLVSTEVS